MNNHITILLLCLVSLNFVQSIAQESHYNAHNEFQPCHAITLLVSHTQISQGINENGNRKWLSLPSWGLNYNYIFHPKWAIGLHNDIIVEDFVVEEHLKSSSNENLKRSYPLASAIVGCFKPGKHFAYLLGAGGEFAHTGNLFLLRIGIEYALHITRSWEMTAIVANDYKFNAYNSWAIGLGITKRL